MLDFERFLSETRACLIAPAGYGKTHTIVECLRRTSGRQLILTHTHAGVAALRGRLRMARIPTSCYELSTIASIAQRLAICFTPKAEVVSCDERGYFTWCITRATELLRSSAIRRMFSMTYKGVFVDEYQDCTVRQHELLLALVGELPMRVLGDPMQGIFGFNEPIVDFDKDLSGFSRYVLTVPRRWERTNPQLGADISLVRSCLEDGKSVDERACRAITFVHAAPLELQRELIRLCYAVPRGDTALVIVSNSKSRKTRCNVARLFNGRCSIVEAIDDKEFYEQAKSVDGISTQNCCRILYELATSLFFKTHIDKWLGICGTIRKQSAQDRETSRHLVEAVGALRKTPSPKAVLECIAALLRMPGISILSHEKCFTLLSAIRCAVEQGGTVLEAMKDSRNIARGMGRCIRPFSVGSTLLTKGLEFDHVIVCDYEPGFNLSTVSDRRHFYVAISRACKSLAIIRPNRR